MSVKTKNKYVFISNDDCVQVIKNEQVIFRWIEQWRLRRAKSKMWEAVKKYTQAKIKEQKSE